MHLNTCGCESAAAGLELPGVDVSGNQQAFLTTKLSPQCQGLFLSHFFLENCLDLPLVSFFL